MSTFSICSAPRRTAAAVAAKLSSTSSPITHIGRRSVLYHLTSRQTYATRSSTGAASQMKSAMQADINRLESAIDELRTNLNTKGGTIETLQASVKSNEGIIETLRKTVSNNENTIKKFQTTLESSESIIKQLQTTVQANDGIIKELQKVVQDNQTTAENRYVSDVQRRKKKHKSEWILSGYFFCLVGWLWWERWRGNKGHEEKKEVAEKELEEYEEKATNAFAEVAQKQKEKDTKLGDTDARNLVGNGRTAAQAAKVEEGQVEVGPVK